MISFRIWDNCACTSEDSVSGAYYKCRYRVPAFFIFLQRLNYIFFKGRMYEKSFNVDLVQYGAVNKQCINLSDVSCKLISR